MNFREEIEAVLTIAEKVTPKEEALKCSLAAANFRSVVTPAFTREVLLSWLVMESVLEKMAADKDDGGSEGHYGALAEAALRAVRGESESS